jgi:hypothetical protein
VTGAAAVEPARGAGREARIVAVLCLLAALRVFLFGAGFPFFNNVDEQAHFDLVHKYARGHVPARLESMDVDAVREIILYGSQQYFVSAAHFPGGVMPPPVWRLPFAAIRDAFEARVRQGVADPNHESTQPPLYYAVAGLWYRLGCLAGLRGGFALYWIRFLDVIVVALLVGLAWRFARTLFPTDRFLALGLPLLIAFLPQDVLYSINNDVLVPLVGGAALLGLFVVARGGEPRGRVFHAVTGLLVAASVLVKISCLPVLAVAAIAVGLGVSRADARWRRVAAGRGVLLLLAAGLPLLAWGLRNVRLLGDWTGSAAKATQLSWTPKPLAAIFDHPIFTPGGLVTFWSETLTSFWRGEYTWGFERIASGGWDLFYSVSSFVLPLAVLVTLVFRGRAVARDERLALWMSIVSFLLALAFLAGVSVAYDFGGCFNPSRDHPFLTSGRLALAALLPFATLYLKGLEAVLPWPRATRLRWVLLIALVTLMTVSELVMSWDALGSAYNWFHML